MKHRRYQRVDAKQVAGRVKGPSTATTCNIENISAGGLFIKTATPMPLGLPVVVELSGPGLEDALQASGRVVSVITPADAARHGGTTGMGIEFDPLPAEADLRLRALLQELGLRDSEPTSNLYATASADPRHVSGNVQGLLEMLTKTLQTVRAQEQEIATLKAEVRRLTSDRRTGRR